VVEGHCQALEVGSQRGAERLYPRNGSVSSACDSCVGAAGARAGARAPLLPRLLADDVEVARCYLRHVARLGRRHSFGFVGEKQGKGMQLMSGDRAAAYLSSYFVRGKGSKATLQENARNPHLPRMLIWVSPTLTRPTGVTMRNLRRCRQLWAVRIGLLPPPSWSGVELARVVALAGVWPVAAPDRARRARRATREGGRARRGRSGGNGDDYRSERCRSGGLFSSRWRSAS
jgi:hypothetical protein